MTYKKKEKKLKPRERLFVEYYLADPTHNATNAMLKVNPNLSRKVAGTSGYAYRHKKLVAEEIDKRLNEEVELVENENRNTIKKKLDFLSKLTIADFYDDDGNAIPLSQLGEKALLIQNLKKFLDKDGNVVIEYQFMPRDKILDMLMKRYGLYEPEEKKIEISMPVVEVVGKKSLEEWNTEEK